MTWRTARQPELSAVLLNGALLHLQLGYCWRGLLPPKLTGLPNTTSSVRIVYDSKEKLIVTQLGSQARESE